MRPLWGSSEETPGRSFGRLGFPAKKSQVIGCLVKRARMKSWSVISSCVSRTQLFPGLELRLAFADHSTIESRLKEGRSKRAQSPICAHTRRRTTF